MTARFVHEVTRACVNPVRMVHDDAVNDGDLWERDSRYALDVDDYVGLWGRVADQSARFDAEGFDRFTEVTAHAALARDAFDHKQAAHPITWMLSSIDDE